MQTDRNAIGIEIKVEYIEKMKELLLNCKALEINF